MWIGIIILVLLGLIYLALLDIKAYLKGIANILSWHDVPNWGKNAIGERARIPAEEAPIYEIIKELKSIRKSFGDGDEDC